jgi:hypothetical protein
VSLLLATATTPSLVSSEGGGGGGGGGSGGFLPSEVHMAALERLVLDEVQQGGEAQTREEEGTEEKKVSADIKND